MNSEFGKSIRINIFGGSHEAEIGVAISGLPRDTEIDLLELQRFLSRRAPGSSQLTTARKEADIPVLRGGGFIIDDHILITDGTELTMIIKNTDRHSKDYDSLRTVPRPGHADLTAFLKYGTDIDMAGGGPFSARMTAPLCVAGGIAMQILQKKGIRILSHIYSIGSCADEPFDPLDPRPAAVSSDGITALNETAAEKMRTIILDARAAKDSVGGIVEAAVTGLPAGLGGPMYSGAESVLTPILFGIPAVKGVEFGAGFKAAQLKGSQNNDPFCIVCSDSSAVTGSSTDSEGSAKAGDAADSDGSDCSGRETHKVIKTTTNNHGGILGGITSGMPLICRVAFKPTPSIGLEQDSVDMVKMLPEKLTIQGRHDPCVVLRAVPVVEAALAAGILDMMLEKNSAANAGKTTAKK